MNCHENGVTRLLLTKIPMFREVLVSSFSCPHCNYADSGIQSASAIQDCGVKYTLQVKCSKDLNRQVVKSDSASVLFPEIGFEIPSGQKGQLTTVEGLLNRAVEGLQQDQPVRRIMHPEVAGKIDEVIEKLKRLMTVDEPFTVVLDDPCGNSFIENLCAPSEDPLLKMESYQRSHEQDIMLGIQPAQTEGVVTENVDTESTAETTTAQATATTDEQEEGIDDSSVIQDDEILTLPTCCPQCHAPSVSRIKPVQIPFFKEVIIMALTCDACGYRSNEVKSGSGISETGTRITLRLTDPTDLSRDILKAETAVLSIPELDFEVISGSMGGRFTTVEGLLSSVIDQMKESFPYAFGDSTGDDKHLHAKKCVADLEKVKRGEMMGVHIIIDDPAGNSYLQNVYAPEDDPEMKVEHYQRTEEQDEELGLDQMKVD